MKIIFGVVLLELIIIAWVDLKTKKISNRWLLFNLFLSIAFHLGLDEFKPFSWEILVFPAGWVIIGFLFFLLKIMGAGDSKYLASLFLLVPVENHMIFFGKLVSSTIIVGMILIMLKVIQDYQTLKSYTLSAYWAGIRQRIKSNFSYAPVILLAWILFGTKPWF